MIIGGSKCEVIENIQKAVADEDFTRKVELGDPNLSIQQQLQISSDCISNLNTSSYKFNNLLARTIEDIAGFMLNLNTDIIGVENVRGITGGAVITGNHFNPLDSTIIRKLVKKTGRNRLYTVSQATNFAVPGFLGFLLYHADTIPIMGDVHYLEHLFTERLNSLFEANQWVLIYPEQEMWFNYRKPRPVKRGAYYYAAKCGVPIISCFVEMQDMDERDNDEFRKVRYTLHVLPSIFPDKDKTVRENSIYMMQTDYEQKCRAYEECYNKKLTYDFNLEDIAGWIS